MPQFQCPRVTNRQKNGAANLLKQLHFFLHFQKFQISQSHPKLWTYPSKHLYHILRGKKQPFSTQKGAGIGLKSNHGTKEKGELK
jgi:hypothetical protein